MMTKEQKIEVTKSMENEKLLECFTHYAKQGFFEMDESKRETYTIVKNEILARMSK